MIDVTKTNCDPMATSSVRLEPVQAEKKQQEAVDVRYAR